MYVYIYIQIYGVHLFYWKLHMYTKQHKTIKDNIKQYNTQSYSFYYKLT